MPYSSRFFLYAPFAVLLALALAAMLRWWAVADAFESQLVGANGHEIVPGVTLRFGSERIGGFPFRLDAVMETVTLEVQAARGPLIWRTDHFALHALTYGRTQEIFEAAGNQTLSWTDADGVLHRFAFVPGSLRASAIARDGRLVRFDLDMTGIGSPDISGARAQLHFRKAPGSDAIDVAMSADALHLAPGLRAGFGAEIPRLEMEGRLIPASRFAALLAGREEWRVAAERWRQAPGSFVLDNCKIVWGGLDAEATGTLSLDPAHRPAGRIAWRLSGAEKLSGAAGAPLASALAVLKARGRFTGPFAVSIALENGSASARRADDTAKIPAGILDALY